MTDPVSLLIGWVRPVVADATIRGGSPDISDQGLSPPADGLVVLTPTGGTGLQNDTPRDRIAIDMHIWHNKEPALWQMYARLHRRLYDITNARQDDAQKSAWPLLTCWRNSGPVAGRDAELRWPTIWSSYTLDYHTEGE